MDELQKPIQNEKEGTEKRPFGTLGTLGEFVSFDKQVLAGPKCEGSQRNSREKEFFSFAKASGKWDPLEGARKNRAGRGEPVSKSQEKRTEDPKKHKTLKMENVKYSLEEIKGILQGPDSETKKKMKKLVQEKLQELKASSGHRRSFTIQMFGHSRSKSPSVRRKMTCLMPRILEEEEGAWLSSEEEEECNVCPHSGFENINPKPRAICIKNNEKGPSILQPGKVFTQYALTVPNLREYTAISTKWSKTTHFIHIDDLDNSLEEIDARTGKISSHKLQKRLGFGRQKSERIRRIDLECQIDSGDLDEGRANLPSKNYLKYLS